MIIRAKSGSLRAARLCIFTGGVVKANGSCRACFLRKQSRGGRMSSPSQSKPDGFASSPKGRALGIEGKFPVELQSVRFRQRLPPRGSCQSRQALTEGVKLPLRGSWHRAAMTERVKPSPWGRWLRPTGADGRGAPPERARTLPGYSFVPNSTFWGENRKRLSKMHKKAAQSLAGTGLTVPGRKFLRNRTTN